MARIYICYNPADYDKFDKLVKKLGSKYKDDNLSYYKPAHDKKDEQKILDEIANCKLFICLFSDKFLQSHSCQTELVEAAQQHKRILPVLIAELHNPYPEDIANEDIKRVLRKKPPVNLVEALKEDGLKEEDLDELYRSMDIYLGRTAPKPTSPSTNPATSFPISSEGRSKSWWPNVSDGQGQIIAAVIIAVMGLLGVLLTASLTNRNSPIDANPLPVATDQFQAALDSARIFSGKNSDWDWVSHIFADDPTLTSMMLVPVGEFMMGRDDRSPGEKPAHLQQITQLYWIDRTEVTREQYQKCVDAGDCTETKISTSSTRPTQPVNRVTWFQAHAFCDWRGGRLPTEVEWEYAARGPDGNLYTWGNEWISHNSVWYDFSDRRPKDVGSIPTGASWVGALDMLGNVWEWVSSLDKPYPYIRATHEDETDTTSRRILRGGSFVNAVAANLSASYRFAASPTLNDSTYGFRCVR